MRFLSVASGIEAASVAWSPLGWKPWAVAEIDAFPSWVLHHHYSTGRPHHMPSPDAEGLTREERDLRTLAISRVAGLPLRSLADGPVNFGDMTTYKEWPDASLDLLCGGTPCQSFSNAGLRAGLDDPRGQLMLTFGAIAAKYRPRWLVWENVPGVLSSNGGQDFGAFLGLLGFLGYGFAYRILDAQFVRVDGHGRAVPQRRNRVFVVGCLGDWRSAAAVLLERESLRGDPAPRREAGARVAATLTRGAESGGKGGYAGRRQEDDVNIIAGALTGASDGAGWRVGSDEASAGQLVTECVSPTLLAGPSSNASHGEKSGADREALVAYSGGAVAATITAQFGEQTGQDAKNGNLMLAFGGNNTAGAIDVATALRAHGGSGHIDFESETFIASAPIAFDPTQITSGENRSNPRPGDPCHTLAKGARAPAIAFQERGREGGRNLDVHGDVAYALTADGGDGGRAQQRNIMVPTMQVRRLTPTECERLMGFPDGYTAIIWRGKPAADGARYKALGNSWATNCARWVGRRIALVDSFREAKP